MPNEEKLAWSYSKNCFPGCGNHRVAALKELLIEEPENQGIYAKHTAKLLLIPPNPEVQKFAKSLFRFDNFEFLNKVALPDTIAYLRTDWIKFFASEDGLEWKDNSEKQKLIFVFI
jgi:hypothetical protein